MNKSVAAKVIWPTGLRQLLSEEGDSQANMTRENPA